MLERWIKPRIENPDPEIRKQAFAEVDPQIHRVHGADRIGNCALGMSANPERGLDCRFQM